MNKSPAFLFYTQDFTTGTQFFTDEQTGKYIRLLCAQHQHGRLAEKHMLSICGAYDVEIFEKFIRDENGLYYNERLENEIIKRDKYTESRRKNAATQKAYAPHMENVNDNKIEDKVKGGSGGMKKGKEFPHHETFGHDLPEVTAGSVIQMFRITQKVDVDATEVTALWDVFKVQHLTGENYYHNKEKVFTHFFNWAKGQKLIKNGKSHSSQPGVRKLNADEARANFIKRRTANS